VFTKQQLCQTHHNLLQYAAVRCGSQVNAQFTNRRRQTVSRATLAPDWHQTHQCGAAAAFSQTTKPTPVLDSTMLASLKIHKQYLLKFNALPCFSHQTTQCRAHRERKYLLRRHEEPWRGEAMLRRCVGGRKPPQKRTRNRRGNTLHLDCRRCCRDELPPACLRRDAYRRQASGGF
jgi:hypothetical protein